MNYLKELRAFREWLLLNDLPTSAIALWHTLMAINNMTGWKERFNAPNSIVEKLTGLSKQGLVNARKKLLEHGLIKYEKGKKGKAPVYQMVSLVKSVDLSVDQSIYQSIDQSTYQSDAQSLTIPKLKQNKTKTNTDDISDGLPRSRAVEFFANNFGNFSPFIADEIEQWVSDLSEDIVLAAMKLALKRNAKNFGYIERILKEWHSEGLKTIDQVRAYENARKERQQSNSQMRRVSERVDKLPKWMTNDMPNHGRVDEKDVKQREKELDEILSRL